MQFETLITVGFMGLGATELIIVLLIILLLFGGAKLPSLARGLGQSIKEFKNAAKDDDSKSGEKKAEAPKAGSADQGKN